MTRPAAIPTRVLGALLAVLVLLALGDGWQRHRREAARRLGSTLRPLVHPALQVVPERERRLHVLAAGGAHQWTYERRGRAWRYPARFDAYASGDRLEFLLTSLLRSSGTVVSTDPDALARFGLGGQQVVRVILEDDIGVPLLQVDVGRPAPGPRGGEVYVRLAAQDTILHLHANPRQALTGGLPPMLDPRVIPRGLERRALVRVDFETDDPSGLRSLRRVEAEPVAETGRPRSPAGLGPTYEWVATYGSRRDTCVNASAYAYLSFLSDLQYRDLVDPAGSGYDLGSGGRLTLVDEDGAVDILEVGAGRQDEVYLHLPSTGLVYTIDADRVRLLMPARQLLLEPLPQPSPYDPRGTARSRPTNLPEERAKQR